MAVSPDSEHFPFLTSLEIPPGWEAAARRFLDQGGTALILGGPDTGKSTLSRYLIYRAYVAGATAAFLDLDLGQSHLGPPASLGLGLFPPRQPGDRGPFPEGLYFIGQTSPVGAILEVAVGCRTLADQARTAGAPYLVVNTSGFIQGPGALRLKKSEVELLNPSLILALQRDQELEPLLRGLGGAEAPESSLPGPGWPVLRLPVSSRVVRRSPEERRRYREESFRRYFSRAERLDLPWRSLVWEGLPLGQGQPMEQEALARLDRRLEVKVLCGESQGFRTLLLLAEPPASRLDEVLGDEWEKVHWLTWPSLRFRLVGLLDGRRRTLALGSIMPVPWDPETLALWTPLPPGEAGRVRFLKVGKMKVTLEGREIADV